MYIYIYIYIYILYIFHIHILVAHFMVYVLMHDYLLTCLLACFFRSFLPACLLLCTYRAWKSTFPVDILCIVMRQPWSTCLPCIYHKRIYRRTLRETCLQGNRRNALLRNGRSDSECPCREGMTHILGRLCWPRRSQQDRPDKVCRRCLCTCP